MPRFLLPDALLPDSRHLLRGRVVVVEEGRVAALEPAASVPAGRLEPFPGELWAAAPILLHGHLADFDAPSQSWPRASFSAWVRHLLAWRRRADRMGPAESARSTLRELDQRGDGFLLAHVEEGGAGGTGMSRLLEDRLRPEVLPLVELLAPAPQEAASLLKELDRWQHSPSWGVALHAPYTVSEELARGVFSRTRAGSFPVSIHLGEHEEERCFLAGGGGPLARLLEENGHPLKRETWASPVDWLEAVGGLREGVLAVHAGNLTPAELHRLERAGVRTVWCPGTHRYFGRPIPAFGSEGAPLPFLGCDSRASNPVLDPLREVRLAREWIPGPGPCAWWDRLTEGAGLALNRPELGRLAPGSLFQPLRIAWEGEGSAEEACNRLTADSEIRPLGHSGPAGRLPTPSRMIP